MTESSFMSSIALTAKSQLNKGNNVGVKDIREKYGDKMSSISNEAIQGIINKMRDKLNIDNKHFNKQEVVMTKQVLDKDDIKNAVEDCLSSGKCSPFNSLSNDIDLNKKVLEDVKSSVEAGCSKLSGIDDLKNKIDKQNDVIDELSKDKNVDHNKGDSQVNKLAIEALKTFSVIRDNESELVDGIKSLININKPKSNEEDTLKHVEGKSDIKTHMNEAIPNKENDFITLDEALKHKEFGVHIVKKILDNNDIRSELINILKVSDKVKDTVSQEIKPKIQDDIDKTNKVVDKGSKMINEIGKKVNISILRKLIGKK